jgi:carboxyl-terminal processing protease
MRRPWRIAAITLFSLALLLGATVGDRLLALTDEARDALRLYTELVSVAEANYAGDVAYSDLVYASINGMLRTLDPHSNFLPPQAYDTMRDRQQGSFYGLGIFVGMRNGRLTVIAPIEGTPASRLGLRAGDVIGTIEGEPTDTMSLDEAVGLLKGPKGTQVKITIVRKGLDEQLEFEITRDEIPQTTVRYAYMLDADTGYIAVSDFSRSTSAEMAEALEKLRGEGMERLVLDLRFNGGGLLDQAVEVADQFLPEGAGIVETRGRTRDSTQNYRAAGHYPTLDIPLVVLVNGGTASAAEILAGAIQDHDLGLIVGTRTWGKGLVQTVYGLSYGAGLALTTAKYYTPSGRLIQRDYSSWYDYERHVDTASVEDGEDDTRQVYSTDLGRTVYGGGGIAPDIEVEPALIGPYLQFLHARNAFFQFSVEFANRRKIGDPEWAPDDEVFDDFAGWLEREEISSPDELEEALTEDPEMRDYVLRQIRAEVFNSSFGIEARHRALTPGDRQLREALEQFDEASNLLVARRDLDRAPVDRVTASLGESLN